MANPEILKEFEAGLNPPEAQTEQVTETPQVEELEIALGGKPFKLPVNVEVPVKHNGQILKTPLDKLLNSFRQGQHYEEKFKEFKTEREKFEAERGDFEQFKTLKGKYGDLQTWSEQNPEQWERLHQLWQNREAALKAGETGNAETAILNSQLQQVQNELKELKGWKSEWDKQQEEKQIAEDTQLIKKEIEEFQGKWKEIDLNEKDLDGYTLKSRIMKYGIDNKIPNFALAARGFLDDRLSDILVQRGRTEAVKNVQKDTQQGILARSDKPFSGQSPEVDPTKLSSSDLKRAAAAELERGLAGINQ